MVCLVQTSSSNSACYLGRSRQGDMRDDGIGYLIPYYNINTTKAASGRSSKVLQMLRLMRITQIATRMFMALRSHLFQRAISKVKDLLLSEARFSSITKSSGNTPYTDGNNCCLLRAQSTPFIVTKQTDVVGTITTDAAGKGSLANLNAGEYYLKETKAPKGYALAADEVNSPPLHPIPRWRRLSKMA